MRIDIPQHKKLVHEARIPMRWSDMDALGHVNNATYFTYLEIARVDWLEHFHAAPDPRRAGPVIVNAFCSFLRQLEYPGELVVKLHVGAVGRSSFDTYATIERADQPGEICAEGGATTVWVDFAQRRPVPLPDWLRERLS